MQIRAFLLSISLMASLIWVLPQGLAQISREELKNSSWALGLPFKSIGPDIFSGRVVDLEVNPDTPTHFIVAFATGGLWETRNNGRLFQPLFEGVTPASLGDIAVDWAIRRIWVGTGENNSSRSSYAGDGLYVSDNWGQSWRKAGLDSSRHIGRIVLMPGNPDEVIVAALGGLYTPGGQRGIFRSTDAGKTWTATLPGSEFTGGIDLIRDPLAVTVLYASTWDRERHAWNFREAGVGSAIFRSEDNGQSWSRLDGGFPKGENVGRIGLSVADSAGQTYLYALLDNQTRREAKPGVKLSVATLGDMTGDIFSQLDSAEIALFLKDNGFPLKQYPLDSLRREARAGKFSPKVIQEYLQDANSQLFDTPVVGAELYRSLDGGKSWKRTHLDYLDDVFYSYGYYFAQVRVDPKHPSQVYVMGAPAIRSENGGKSWAAMASENVHADHHAMWINPKDGRHLILGNDGGVNISYDAGRTTYRIASPPAGQFYAVAVDNAKPYRVYGGTQDNGVWRGPSNYKSSAQWETYGDVAYHHLYGGDGMQVQIDPRDNETVYTGFQFGNYVRIDPDGSRTDIQPKHKLGERPLRFNWQTPIWLSRHNADVFYIGSNKFHRSLDKGKSYSLISQDLTLGGKPGDVPYGTLTSIHESPLRFGLIYVGSDDGLVHVSSDGGYTWQRISDSLPAGKWVSRVQASAHVLDRVYVSMNGYRDDDPTPYLFVSDDRGKSWNSIAEGLLQEPINDILEDSKRRDLLYVATDGGLYYSQDLGEEWHVLGDLPLVPIHDLVVQEREEELLVGTHGRSLFVGSIAPLRNLVDSVGGREIFAFTPSTVAYNPRWGKAWSKWASADTPRVAITLFSKTAQTLAVRFLADDKTTLSNFEIPVTKGIHVFEFPLSFGASELTQAGRKSLSKADDERYYLKPGQYQVEFSGTGKEDRGAAQMARIPLRVEQVK